jgi:hypothetical protein
MKLYSGLLLVCSSIISAAILKQTDYEPASLNPDEPRK